MHVTAVLAPEPLTALPTLIVNSVLVQGLAGNVGAVFVGNAAYQQVQLNALDVIVVVINDLNKVYIRVLNAGDGVSYVGS